MKVGYGVFDKDINNGAMKAWFSEEQEAYWYCANHCSGCCVKPIIITGAIMIATKMNEKELEEFIGTLEGAEMVSRSETFNSSAVIEQTYNIITSAGDELAVSTEEEPKPIKLSFGKDETVGRVEWLATNPLKRLMEQNKLGYIELSRVWLNSKITPMRLQKLAMGMEEPTADECFLIARIFTGVEPFKLCIDWEYWFMQAPEKL